MENGPEENGDMRVGENKGIEGVVVHTRGTMPRFSALLLMHASVWYACISGAVAAASTLKVAACKTYEPYVVGTDDQLTGFDIQFWGLVYQEMKHVANMNRDTTVLTLLGDAAPPISVMTRENLLQAVKDGTVDVGMCGFQIDSQDHMMLDYSYPVIKTGFRGIIKNMMKSATVTSMAKVAWESMFRGISPSAVFAMLILLMFSVCFSNIIYFLERNENPLISKTYCWGVFDAWWMIIVTALTVGYGH